MDEEIPRLIRAEAALWVTRLHGPHRDPTLESGFRRWLADDPRHAAAFELATDAWQRSGDLATSLPMRSEHFAPRFPRLRFAAAVVASTAVTCVAVLTALHFLRDGTFATGPGEQRMLTLSDGTQVTMNANSRMLVQFDDHVRMVALAAGEASFDVAKHQVRPFAVVIGDRKVVALGTSFMVRRDEPGGSAFTVTLLEGRVAVEPLSLPDVLPGQSAAVRVLRPGERLRFADHSPEIVDSPSIERVTAWRRGLLIFDDASLSEAAAEFNRYGPVKITIGDADIGKIRVGGVFNMGDPTDFAQAVANTYDLRIINRTGEIVMTTKPLEEKSSDKEVMRTNGNLTTD
jgi:transmembrane sensor